LALPRNHECSTWSPITMGSTCRCLLYGIPFPYLFLHIYIYFFVLVPVLFALWNAESFSHNSWSLHTPLALAQDKMVSPSKLLYACMHSCEHDSTSLKILTFKFSLDHQCREDICENLEECIHFCIIQDAVNHIIQHADEYKYSNLNSTIKFYLV